MTLLNRMIKLIDLINVIFRNIGSFCIIALIIILFTESILRLLGWGSIVVVDEIGGLGMYIFIALNFAPLYRQNEHLIADVLFNKLSKKAQHIIQIFLHVFTIIYACFATYTWWRFILIPTFHVKRHLLMSNIIEWPSHLIGVLGWSMLAITAAECLVIEINKDAHQVNGGN